MKLNSKRTILSAAGLLLSARNALAEAMMDKAVVQQWSFSELITPVKCIGRFFGCFPDCPLQKCFYRQI